MNDEEKDPKAFIEKYKQIKSFKKKNKIKLPTKKKYETGFCY